MRTIIALVMKDLSRKRARPAATIILLAFPVILSVIIGLAFGGRGGGAELPPIDVLVSDEDGSFLSRFLTGAEPRGGGAIEVRFRKVERAEGEALLARGKASALLVIPAGFGDRFMAGDPDTLLVRRNPAEAIKPAVATEYVNVTALILGAGGTVLAEPLAAIQDGTAGKARLQDDAIAAIAVSVSRAVTRAAAYLDPPLVTLDTSSAGKPEERRGPLAIALFLLPGLAVMAIMMIGQSAMGELLRERAMGTLGRTFAAPVGAGEIIAAKFAGVAALGAIAFVVLAAICAAWRAPRVDPAGLVLLAASFIVAVVGMNALVYGFAKNERQGSTVAEIIILGMSFLGGSWIPLSSLGAGIRRLSPFTLNYWAVEGFGRLLFDHAGPAALARNVAVLLAIGAIGAAGGAILLRRRLTEGAA